MSAIRSGFNIYLIVCVLFIVIVCLGGMQWSQIGCPPRIPNRPCPACPVCPEIRFPSGMTLEGCIKSNNENDYMKDMIRYLTMIVKRYEAEKELYVLSHGYAQVYNSPKMEYVKKELRRMKKKIKSDPKKTRFFEMHLNNIIE